MDFSSLDGSSHKQAEAFDDISSIHSNTHLEKHEEPHRYAEEVAPKHKTNTGGKMRLVYVLNLKLKD